MLVATFLPLQISARLFDMDKTRSDHFSIDANCQGLICYFDNLSQKSICGFKLSSLFARFRIPDNFSFDVITAKISIFVVVLLIFLCKLFDLCMNLMLLIVFDSRISRAKLVTNDRRCVFRITTAKESFKRCPIDRSVERDVISKNTIFQVVCPIIFNKIAHFFKFKSKCSMHSFDASICLGIIWAAKTPINSFQLCKLGYFVVQKFITVV